MQARRGIVPFTNYPLDRADTVRKDRDAVAALWRRQDARVLAFWRGKPLVLDQEGACVPVWLKASDVPEERAFELFLGLDEAGAPTFAVAFDPAVNAPPMPSGAFSDLRASAMRMGLVDTATVGTARGVFAWHRTHQFCANCGAGTALVDAGWKRHCARCDREQFPRVEPVVIMLISHDDRVLVGRAPKWPPGMFSCLAGFMEPGETLGDATRREAAEEAGVRIGDVEYVMSQPWPFPASLMLGVHAYALSDRFEVDGVELAEARWLGREEVADVLRGEHPDVRAPFPIAVAHHLLRWWVHRLTQD